MVWPGLFLVEWILFFCYLLGFYNFFAIRKLIAERKNEDCKFIIGNDVLFIPEVLHETNQVVA